MHVSHVHSVLLSVYWWQSHSVMDAPCCTFAGRRPLSSEQPGSRVHYMHHSLNTVLPLARTPSCPHIDGYGLQHVITVIGSLWRDPHQSSLVSPQRGMLGCEAAWHVREILCVTQSMLGKAVRLVVSQNNWWPLMLWVTPVLDILTDVGSILAWWVILGQTRRKIPGTTFTSLVLLMKLCFDFCTVL